MIKTSDFLLEIGTAELPPKAMPILADVLADEIYAGLIKHGLVNADAQKPVQRLAAPRRLAFLMPSVSEIQPDQIIEKWGPALTSPPAAIEGFAKSCETTVAQLEKRSDGKNERYYFAAKKVGVSAVSLLPTIVNEAIKKLPIPRPMRWGSYDTEFIRPVQWAFMLLGDHVIEADILGKKTGRVTYGHRFHHPDAITIKQPSDYVKVLAEKAYVLVDFQTRREKISTDIKTLARKVNGIPYIDEALLDEVTAIVEWPVALCATFAKDFLSVPKEALMSAMQQHQKSFPIIDANGNLLPYFIFIANIDSRNAQQVIQGNEKVMRARLSDAKFFYETDKEISLAEHLETLKTVLFQKELGTLYDRSQRISQLAAHIADAISPAEKLDAQRAGLLAKCDLVTNMVGEFPELQGIMGDYYARTSGEAVAVALAIREQYQPAFADDVLPQSMTGVCVALAEKMDTLVGIFGINQKPTGTKDPFALRRAAIGVLRLIIEKKLDIDLLSVLKQAAAHYQNLPNQQVITDVHQYIVERLQYWSGDKGYSVGLFNAVKAVQQNNLYDFYRRVIAVDGFAKLPEAKQLAEANKRVKNILESSTHINAKNSDVTLFQQPAEQNLYKQITAMQAILSPLVAKKDYAAILKNLAELKTPVEQFFVDVMVMVEDTKLRDNRLLLLQQLRNLFLMVADISALS